MIEDRYDELITKLSLQVESFQEGFGILAKSNTLTELANNFKHILRGSLLVVDVNLFHQQKDGNNWNRLSGNNEEAENHLQRINDSGGFSLEFVKDGSIKCAVFIPLTDGSKFTLLIGQKFDKSEFGASDKVIIQIFAQLLDNSYQSYIKQQKEKNLVFELNHRVLQLNSLIDTGIEISKLQELHHLYELSLERAVTITSASFGYLLISENDKIISSIFLPKGIDQNDVDDSEYKISTELEYQNRKYLFCLANKESRTGYVDFDPTDSILLDAFARQVLAAVENEHLHKEAIEKENIKRELSVAAEIQDRILPKSIPEVEGYDIAGSNISSKEVGGDYYDCKLLKDGRIALIIADVAGKGVPASLLVSTLNASLNAYLELDIPLPELAKKINTVVYTSSPSDKFITFFIAVLTPQTGELDMVNAGHNPILIRKVDGTLDKVEAGGVAFGMFDMGLPFEGSKRILEKGERILLYTDGIPEAMNEVEDEYSDERLEDFIVDHATETASEFIEAIIADVKSFTKDTPQSDDITALFVERK